MKYYTDGYEFWTTDKSEIPPEEILGEIDLDYKEGDYFLKVLLQGSWDGARLEYCDATHSLESALEGWACNCDEIYQIRDGVAIYEFDTQGSLGKMNCPIDSLMSEFHERFGNFDIEWEEE